MNFIAYYRVSTKSQGDSGLGLSSQKESVQRYISSVNGNLLQEYMEVESGGNTERKYLHQAIAHALRENAVIVVKRLDRLSRDGFRISTMLDDMGVGYIDCDSPHDNPLIKNIKLAMAKDEKDKISERTKNALEVINHNIEKNGFHISRSGRRITSLGNISNLGGKKAIEASRRSRRERALNHPNNIKARAVINLMMQQEGTTYVEVARYLNENGFRTSRDNDFSPVQVGNLHRGYKKQETYTKNN